MKRIALTTLGCKANWADTEAMAQRLSAAGFCIVPVDEEAWAYVINTCTVTRLASAQSRQLLRRLRRAHPGAAIVATGCYGETSAGELRAMPEVDAVFGTSDRESVIDFLSKRAGLSVEEEAPGPFGRVPAGQQSRARAFLKIQEGCDHRCAYCIVPAARGRSRSLATDAVVSTCASLSGHHREIILAGIDVGQYGRDLLPPTDLISLMESLAATPGMARLRVSSLRPGSVDRRLVSLLSSRALCRHVHLSIQSGSDAVLVRMGRGYRAAAIEEAAMRLAGGVPEIAITGDVIAGFPGETEEEHRETARLVASLPLAGLHVFPFSAREGTRAAAMPGQVAHAVRRGRAAELRSIGAGKRETYLRRLINGRLDVIVTSRKPDARGLVSAVGDTGVEVLLPEGGCGYGELGAATITKVSASEVQGVWG